jgi:hypothetical protein
MQTGYRLDTYWIGDWIEIGYRDWIKRLDIETGYRDWIQSSDYFNTHI